MCPKVTLADLLFLNLIESDTFHSLLGSIWNICKGVSVWWILTLNWIMFYTRCLVIETIRYQKRLSEVTWNIDSLFDFHTKCLVKSKIYGFFFPIWLKYWLHSDIDTWIFCGNIIRSEGVNFVKRYEAHRLNHPLK